MFDSVLVLDGVGPSQRARAELTAAAAGLHVVLIAALIAAQTWRIDSVTPPPLPTEAFVEPLEVVLDLKPAPPAPPQPPKPEQVSKPAPAPANPAPPAPDPNEIARQDVPLPGTTDAAPLSEPSFGSGAPGIGAATDGAGLGVPSGIGEAPAIEWNPGLVPPVVITRIEPVYPRVAQVQRKNGVVHLRAEISADGLLRDLEVVAAQPAGLGFEQSALAAVRQWRFRPATTLDGTRVAVRYQLQVTFTIR